MPEKPENEALVREFEAAKTKYLELLKKAAEARLAGVISSVAAACGVGEVCHGGKF